jgi:uncharacterized membrane protein YphA (DoxX/SURF4 family)
MKTNIIIEVILVLLIILFLYTGISKMTEFTIFKEQIATSPLLAPIAPYISFLLPFTEFLVVILLIIPTWRLKGLYASSVLMTVFTGYVVFILISNDRLPCSCGGIIELLSWKQHLVLNIGLILLSIVGIILETKIRKKENDIPTANTKFSI